MCNYISYYTYIMDLFYVFYFLKLVDRLEQIFPSRTGVCSYILVCHVPHLPKYLFMAVCLWLSRQGFKPVELKLQEYVVTL